MAASFVWIVAALIGVQCVRKVSAHGKLTVPKSRNEIEQNGGGCAHCLNTAGPCGDGSSGKYVNYYAGPQATWTAGSVVPITVQVTAHHRGHYEFRICDRRLNSSVSDPDACLNKWVLERATPEEAGFNDCEPGDEHAACVPFDAKHPERWYLPPSGEVSLIHTIYFKVPAGLQCEECTMQWHWWSANSCIPAGDYGCYKDILQSKGYWVGSKSAWWTAGSGSCSGPAGPNGHSGCGEQFWNCADVKVLAGSGGGSTATTTTTQAPATRTTTTTLSPATTTSTTTSTAPAVTSCQAVDGAEELGATDSLCTAACATLPAGHWPCGPGHLCDCSGVATTTAAATTTTTTTQAAMTTTAGAGGGGGGGARTCLKTPGLSSNGATDSNCAQCTTYKFWPCNGKEWSSGTPMCTCTGGSLAEVSSHSTPAKKAKGQTFLGTALLQDGAVTTHAEAVMHELGEEL